MASKPSKAKHESRVLTSEGSKKINTTSSVLPSPSQPQEEELMELKQKLASLEGKLLSGERQLKSESVAIDQRLLQGYTKEQELELERSRAKLTDQVDRERAIRDELERREEAELLAMESFGSIQQEIDTKRRLVIQILLKIKDLRKEIDVTQETYRLELDELDQLQYVLQKELKLKCLIMDNFIPNNHVDQLLSRIVYDDKTNSCSVLPFQVPSEENGCVLGDDGIDYPDFWLTTNDSFRPRSEFERIGETINPNNIRYKYENLIEPKLELPDSIEQNQDNNREASGQDKTNVLPSHQIQALIDAALDQDEADIVI